MYAKRNKYEISPNQVWNYFKLFYPQGPNVKIKDYYPIVKVYFKDTVNGFLKRIPLYSMNAWFERNFGLNEPTSSANNSRANYSNLFFLV